MTDLLHLVVLHTWLDPQHPSGGNRYDRELADGLRSLGHRVTEHTARGSWTSPDDDFATVLGALPDRATVLVDGLVGLAAGDVLCRERHRLRLWLLVHLPLALALPGSQAREQRALTAATGVITTSDWTRRWLLKTYGLEPARVWAARPGVHPSALSDQTSRGGSLLTVGAVVPDKGHDVLVDALASLADLPWSCRVVGPLDRDPAFVDRLRRQVRRSGLQDRISLTGPLSPAEVSSAYETSDLLVLPTRLEMYGMVLTEALAHGLPVVASDTGGVAEAVGAVSNGVEPGAVPGMLVPPSDADSLSTAVRGWLEDPALREQLRIAARVRRAQLPDWSSTARSIEAALRHTVVNQTEPSSGDGK